VSSISAISVFRASTARPSAVPAPLTLSKSSSHSSSRRMALNRFRPNDWESLAGPSTTSQSLSYSLPAADSPPARLKSLGERSRCRRRPLLRESGKIGKRVGDRIESFELREDGGGAVAAPAVDDEDDEFVLMPDVCFMTLYKNYLYHFV